VIEVSFQGRTWRLTWDEEKRRLNRRKHGIDFADLAALFGRFTIDDIDHAHSYDEIRHKVVGPLGQLGPVTIAIVTDRFPELRVISARRANRVESGLYWLAFFGDTPR